MLHVVTGPEWALGPCQLALPLSNRMILRFLLLYRIIQHGSAAAYFSTAAAAVNLLSESYARLPFFAYSLWWQKNGRLGKPARVQLPER